MTLKTSLLVGFAVLATSSYASFDLMYVADGVTRQIHRVDPINRVSLGTFGAGFLSNPLSVALDSQNIVHVLDANPGGTRVRKFDGSTGEYLGGFSLIGSAGSGARLRISGNRMFYTLGSGAPNAFILSTDLNGGYQGFLTGTEGSVNAQGIGIINNRVVWSGNQPAFTRHNVYATTVSAAFDGSFVNYFWQENSGGATMSHLAANGSRLLYTSSSGYSTLWDGNLSYAGNVSITGFSSVVGTAAGHQDLFHVAGMAGGVFSVSRLYASTLDGLSPVAIAGTGITDPRDFAVVLAPEPGTMAALGLGLAALLRMRRRK